jgi:putative two-component system response regulator
LLWNGARGKAVRGAMSGAARLVEDIIVNRQALLIVEHDETHRSHLKERIAAITPPGMEVMAAASAEEGLGILYSLREQNRPIELVIAAQGMPGIPGGRLLEIVNAQFAGVGKILLSNKPSLEEAIYALNNAGLDKYIPMPWDPEDLKFTVTALLRQREMKRLNEKLLSDLQSRNQQLTSALGSLQAARDELEHSYVQTVESLAIALEAKDRYTSGHSQRVAKFARLVARSLGLAKEEIDVVGQVALLHDIGKIGMLDKILNKPANLTAEEREAIKAHPVIGAQILAPVATFAKHVAGIKHHHEMFDGTGYPDRLKGTDIPLSARIVCLADAFDAMTSTRPYRVGLPLEFAMQEMKKMAGRQFCPECVDAFIRVLKSKGVVEDESDAVAIPGSPASSDSPAPAAEGAVPQDGQLRTGT